MSEHLPEIPQANPNLVQEFAHFIVHNKAWWMTPIVVILMGCVFFIFFVESSPIIPIIYAGL